MYKLLIKQLKRHPIVLFFLISGYIISLLIISIGITNMLEVKKLALARTEGTTKNSLSIKCNLNTEIKFNEYIDLFKDLSENVNIKFTDNNGYIDDTEQDKIYSITYEFFNKVPDWTYPIVNGRYYTEDEIKSGEKVVLIGKNLEKYINNNENNLDICGDEYKVIGIIGKDKEKSPWDSMILMPATSMPDVCKKELLDSQSINFTLYSNENNNLDDYNIIKEKILNFDKENSVTASEASNSNDLIANSLGSNSRLKKIGFLIYIISLINSVNITSIWIDERKIEIGIKKAFGHSNFNIADMLFKEIIVINLFACIIGFLIQYMVSLFNERFSDLSLNISSENFLAGVLMVFISSIVTSIIPIYKSLKIEPIEALRK